MKHDYVSQILQKKKATIFWGKMLHYVKDLEFRIPTTKETIYIYLLLKNHKLFFYLSKWILNFKKKIIVVGCTVVIHIFEPCAFNLEFQHFIYL